ncbi:MAG TPA: LysR family transcriptional regulator [Stenomitos sp.]
MNLDQLRTFATAADTLNFTQAARMLHISQPAVSQQIRELESSLKVTLFERRGRTLALTPAGERLRPLALDLLSDVKRTEDELSEFRGIPQGVFLIGAESTPGTYLLPQALGDFTREYPGVRISLRVSDMESIERALQDGELDLAVTETEPSPGRLCGWERIPFLKDDHVIITPPDHPWAGRGELELKELDCVPFIARLMDSPLRQMGRDRLAAAGYNPDRLTIRFELSSTEAIKHAVMAGLGVGFAPVHAIRIELETGRLAAVGIRGVKLDRSMWLVTPQGRKLPGYQQRFVDTLLSGDWLAPRMRLEEAMEKAL